MRETALQCKHTGGKPPLGYDVDPVTRKLIINPQEAEAVKLIFSMYSEGCGYSEVIDALHEAGYKTKKGQEFLKSSLYSIITNPKYAGIYVFNRSSSKSIMGTRNTHLLKNSEDIITIEGGVPQIVDERTFFRVQKRIDSNKHIGARNKAKTVYLLAGKVFCRVCSRSMTGNTRYCGRNKAKYVTYRCPTKHYLCNNKEINQEYLDRFVMAMLEVHIFNDTAIQEIAKKIEAMSGNHTEIIAEERNKLQAKLDEVSESIINITNVIMSGIVSTALTDKLAELEQERGQIEADMLDLEQRDIADRDTEADILSIPLKYDRLKGNISNPKYKIHIQDFIEKIEVGRYELSITLKTGLDLYPALDTVLTVRRQEVYEGNGGS